MRTVIRPAPFSILSTAHGTMIVNRNDYHMVDAVHGYGVGFQLMTQSCFDPLEIDFALALLEARCWDYGNGIVALDCGANIGVHTIEWAKLLHKRGHVYAFEAQEKIYYCLAGNVVINNCLNVTARHAAVGAENGLMAIPELDYLKPSSYGSFEIRGSDNPEFIGQQVDYDHPTVSVQLITLDSLKLKRVDFIKIDVEGMEWDVLQGAMHTIQTCKPQMIIETLKSDKGAICAWLEQFGYRTFPMGINTFAIHQSDPSIKRLGVKDGVLGFSFEGE